MNQITSLLYWPLGAFTISAILLVNIKSSLSIQPTQLNNSGEISSKDATSFTKMPDYFSRFHLLQGPSLPSNPTLSIQQSSRIPISSNDAFLDADCGAISLVFEEKATSCVGDAALEKAKNSPTPVLQLKNSSTPVLQHWISPMRSNAASNCQKPENGVLILCMPL